MQIRCSGNGLRLECPTCKHAIQGGRVISETSHGEGVVSLPFAKASHRAS
jgi:hypothetical protein